MAACGALKSSTPHLPSCRGRQHSLKAPKSFVKSQHHTRCISSVSLQQQYSGMHGVSDQHRLVRRTRNAVVVQAAAAPGSTTLPIVSTEEEFDKTVADHDLLIVDFMARWCRKCIYLKPKLERMLREDFPGLPVLFIDVNAVPSAVIKNAGIKKMPTIQLYKAGKRTVEHIAAEGAIDALEKIKLMILNNTDLKLPAPK